MRVFPLALILILPLRAELWTSALYPVVRGTPHRETVAGFQLPDFSFAGYHAGEADLPRPEPTHRVGPLADPEADATQHLQSAINQAAGGVLLILPGTYPVTGELVIPSRTIVRGSGTVESATPTRIFMAKRTDTANTSILVANRSPMTVPRFAQGEPESGETVAIVGEVAAGDSSIRTERDCAWRVGDWVAVGNQTTDALRQDYNGTTTVWKDPAGFRYLRQLREINGDTLQLDHAIPHLLQARDYPYISRIDYLAEEIGIEDLSLGFLTPADDLPWHMGKGGSGRLSSYHNARAITLGNVVNAWVRNVNTYSPDGDGHHLHSRGITVIGSRWVTLVDCFMGPTSHRGGAGNGYLYSIDLSNHVLVQNCSAQGGRHNFLFGSFSSECVISGGTSLDSLLTNDMHGSFNHAILVENMTIAGGDYPMGDAWQSRNRGGASNAVGYTGGDVVFWNLRMPAGPDGRYQKTINSDQAAVNGAHGYVIGVTRVTEGQESNTATEWREGIGKEASLRPQSLYDSMLEQRLRAADPPESVDVQSDASTSSPLAKNDP